MATKKDMMQTFDFQVKISTYGVVFINKVNCAKREVFKTKCVNENTQD